MGHSSAQIFKKFDDNSKKENIEGLKRTYFGVLLSIELNSRTSEIAKDIKEQIKSLISSGQNRIESEVTVNGKSASVTLTRRSEGTYNVKFDGNASVGIKDTKDYTAEDLLTLCAQHELTVSKGEYSVTIKGESNGKSATVGGPGKILIFPQHLSYIKETIEHLEEGRNPTKEFALATGTGKTFIELLTQYLPARLMGVPYMSLAPNDNLVTQKRDDWKKVLSNADIDDIELEKISGGCSILSSEGLMKNWDQFLEAIGLEELPNIIEALGIGDKKFEIRNGKITIDDKDFVILRDKIQFGDKEYEIQDGKVAIDGQKFKLNTEKSISLSFDEEHRVAEQELYKYRMEILSTLFPTLFLSATPSIKTHRHVKESDGLVKTLSLKDKMKSGVYGKLDLQVHQKLKDKNLAKEYSSSVEEYVTFKESNQSSSINLTDDELKKEVENYLYKNVQSVIGEPALILAESKQQINNLELILQLDRIQLLPEITSSLLTKGLTFIGKKLFSVPDYKLVTESKKFASITKHIAERFNITSEKAAKILKEHYDFSGIADYSAFRVMHGIIENTLSCLTGLDKHELDAKRCSDLEGLAEEVKAALNNNHDLETYVKNQGVKSDELKKKLVQQMQSVIGALKENKDSDLFIRLVRNWNQDKKLHILMPPTESGEGVSKKLVDLLGEDHHAIVRDYLEYYGVEESKINELCQLGKKVEKRVDSSLGENGKKLLKELRTALGITPKNCTRRVFGSDYDLEHEYNKERYPLKELQNFCNENKYKVKLKNLGDLSAEDLKSKLLDYISCQQLKIPEKLKKQSTIESLENQSPPSGEGNNTIQMLEMFFDNNNKGNILSRFMQFAKDLNQKDLVEAIENLSKDELKDLHQYLLEEENDYHALCRMGLVGNDINPTKVQGYNDINLQHVVMLIDPASTDLNQPAQLIQAPGRLRCLNPNRPSAFFCYSSGKLKFNINLLKEGDYISVYSKSVAKLSNRRVCGNKLATEIIDDINQEIKSLKRIDDLAGQSINIALNAFIEVYNTNQHDFNKSKKEFIGVLKHARRKLNNYEKELRGSGSTFGMKTLRMLIKAIIMVGYLLSRFTYYLATRNTYNEFLKKVNELKNDPNVATYAHIIAEYSIKNVMEIELLGKKCFEAYMKKEKPQDETDTKSFNNYLEHINACLKHPVYLKLFDKITSPLMKDDYLLKLLNQSFPKEDNQDKVERLKIFRKNLKDKSFQFTKDDLDNVEQIQFYLMRIVGRIRVFTHYYYDLQDYDKSIIPPELLKYRVNDIHDTEESETYNGMRRVESKKSSTHKECYVGFQQTRAWSACKDELKILSKREEIKLAKETADYVISPLLGDSSKVAKSGEAKEVTKNIVTVAGQVKNDLEKNFKPFTTKGIFSPDTKFINPIVKSFSGKEYTSGGFSFVYGE